jgi:hypothetical protein
MNNEGTIVCYHSGIVWFCGGEMPKTHPAIDRYWSLAAALILPVVEFFAEVGTRGFWGYYQVVRAVLSVACITLLFRAWFMQRRYSQSKWRLAFLTLLLILFTLGPIWLGLNVLRYYAHPMNWNRWESWQNVCNLQYRVEQLAQALGIAVTLWVILDSVRWLVKRVQARE